jgi:hypothetical protein
VDVEIVSDGRCVWVNDDQGACIGRFSKRGVDVHRTLAEQLAEGKQCLVCSHGTADWDVFVSAMLEHHGVAVGSEHRPSWVQVSGR